MPITAFFAGALSLIFIFLAVVVIRRRQRSGVVLGHGDTSENTALLSAVRAHGNFAEYVPLFLITMALAESLAAPAWLLVTAGISMTFGRAVHAAAVLPAKQNIGLRVAGMMATLTALGLVAGACLLGATPRFG